MLPLPQVSIFPELILRDGIEIVLSMNMIGELHDERRSLKKVWRVAGLGEDDGLVEWFSELRVEKSSREGEVACLTTSQKRVER